MMIMVVIDYDNIEIQQQYSDVNNCWDVDDWDNENSFVRFFECFCIKVLVDECEVVQKKIFIKWVNFYFVRVFC